MKRIIPIITLTIGLLTSCASETKNKPVELPTVKVTTKKVALSTENYTIQSSGKVVAKQSANISTRAMGNVKNIAVKVGEFVKKGQLLIALDDSDLKARLAQAESGIQQAKANLKNVETNYNRIKNLFASKSASQKEFDDATTHYNVAKSQFEAAKQNKIQVLSQLNYTQIKAPFNGLITQKMIKEGDLANPGMPLLAIENKKNLEIVTTVSESDIANIDETSKAKVLIPSLNISLEASIKELSSSAKNTNGQYAATLSLIEENSNILSGMYAKVMFKNKSSALSEKLVMDKNALVKKGQLTGVYTISQSNTAILQWIQIGNEKDNQVEVISGLNHGDKYITSADGKLFNGVTIISK